MNTAYSQTAFPVSLEVNIRPARSGGTLLALATVTLAGCFVVRDVKVIRGKNGLFVAMPSRPMGEGYRDTCFPCTAELKRQFDQLVLEAYGQMTEENHEPGQAGTAAGTEQ